MPNFWQSCSNRRRLLRAFNLRRSVAAANPALIQAIVAALNANGTPAAQRILERLVAGTQNTADPQSAAEAALKALLQRRGRQTEDLLFRVIAAPEPPAATDHATVDPNKLRSVALDWVKSSASEAFRLRLANYMVAPATPQVTYHKIWDSLSEPRIENLAAQIALYQSDQLTDSARNVA